MSILDEWARRIPNAEIVSHQVAFAPPWHSSRDRSATLKPSSKMPGGAVLHSHAGDDWRDLRDYVAPLINLPRLDNRVRRESPSVRAETSETDKAAVAAALWLRSGTIEGTLGELYMSKARRISCPLPPTMRFLPATLRHPPALITAFAIPREPESEALSMDGVTVRAIHMIRLQANATKIGKIMLGRTLGLPLVLAPWTETGRGLVIAEGVEDALSAHEATGLAAWAGGSAGHMEKLAPHVPDWVETVSIVEDANDAGRRATQTLAEDLHRRGFEVLIIGGAHDGGA